MHPLFLAVISICLSVAAQFFLKTGMSSETVKSASANSRGVATFVAISMQPYVIAGFVAYGLGAIVWLFVLSRWDVSKAYPLVGIGFALSVLIGFAMGEQVGLPRGIGVILICTGVWVVAQS